LSFVLNKNIWGLEYYYNNNNNNNNNNNKSSSNFVFHVSFDLEDLVTSPPVGFLSSRMEIPKKPEVLKKGNLSHAGCKEIIGYLRSHGNQDLYLDVSENRNFTSKSSILMRVFHYKPSILGYHYFWKHLWCFLGGYSCMNFCHLMDLDKKGIQKPDSRRKCR